MTKRSLPGGRPASHDDRPGARARRGVPLADTLSDVLAEAIAPIEPPPARVDALRERLLKRVRAASVARPAHFEFPCADDEVSPGIVVVRHNSGGWVDLLPGVRAKLLFSDGRAETVLLDCDPGATLFPHAHGGIEECLVVRGRVEFDDGIALDAGDYEMALDGSRHAAGRTPVPTLLMLRTSQPIHSYFAG
jgi:hypothetical protein